MLDKALIKTSEELQKFASEHFAWVQACLQDGDHDSWMPHLAVLVFDPESGRESIVLHAIAVPFNTDKEKRGILRQLGAELYGTKLMPVLAVLSAEAWLSKDPRYAAGNDSRPEFDPQRQEVIVCMAATFCCQLLVLSSLQVHRNGSNKIVPDAKPRDWMAAGRSPLLEAFWAGFAMACPPFAAAYAAAALSRSTGDESVAGS